MGILTTTDALYFAPSLSSMSSDQLGALINYVNFLVESPSGANRELEVQKRTEKLKLNIKLQSAYLSYRPIILDDPVDYPINIKVRVANALNYYGRGVPVQFWNDIDPAQFLIDIDGEIHLFFGQEYPYQFPNYNQVIRPTATEVQVTYYSGLHLIPYVPYATTQPTKEVFNLKVAAGEICKYMTSKLYGGLTSVQVPFDELTLGFSNQVKPFEIPDYLLLPFRKYKPYIKA